MAPRLRERVRQVHRRVAGRLSRPSVKYAVGRDGVARPASVSVEVMLDGTAADRRAAVLAASRAGAPQKEIAASFGLSQQHVSKILRGKA